jgi:uroporphyrinogen-III synthase
MGATLLITRDERPGERELGEELGLRLVFLPLTKIVFDSALRINPPPAPPSDPSFHSESQGGVFHPEPEQSDGEGPHIAHRASHIALTSRNAIEALKQANLLHLLEHRTIWCVGPSTASALGDIPHRISPGTTGEDLANFMIESGVTGEVLHICGNPHRPEFGSRMRDAGCRMQEWVVYETVPVEAELPKEPIDAVAFFSPAAVKQFKALGWTESLHIPYVAIGPTTASELTPYSCTVSSEASFRGVLETTIFHLTIHSSSFSTFNISNQNP